jgi:MerR family mercuric resistance operon transcriptional regulator
MRNGMTIGRLAEAADVNVETIRYYQRRGLIDEPHKPPGGHRRYSSTALRRITFIRRAQQLGFTLEEVKALLGLSEAGQAREVLAMAERKCAVLKSRIDHLEAMHAALCGLVDRSKRARGKDLSPILKALWEDD